MIDPRNFPVGPSEDDNKRWDVEARARMNKMFDEAVAKMPPPCEHEFGSWREFEDGRGGEQFCQKCDLGMMAWSMRFLP